MKHARHLLLMVATLLCSVAVHAEGITAVSQLSNTKLYFVSQPGHTSGTPTSWVIIYENDALLVNSQCGVMSNQDDENQQFAFVSNDGGDTYYLYHPVRKKFVNKDGSLGDLPMNPVYFVAGASEGTFVVYFDASAVINTNDNDGLIINRWGPLSGWGSADEGNSCAITPVGEFDPTEALATFTAAEEEKRKIIEFSRGTDGWIDGTEWYDQSQTIVAYTSPLYRFTDKVETFRITVSLTRGNTKYFCLSELELYDADGNKIELTESNVTSNADHNALNPNTTDGGGLAALFDGQTSTYFHSAWQNMPAEDHYLEVTLPDGGYDAFSFRMVSRGIGTDGYTQYHTFPGDMVITTSVALESTGTPGGNDEPTGPLTELSAADPTKCYTITTNGRGAWAVNAAGSVFSSTSTEGLSIDTADARQQFAILSANGEDYYLYSVSAKKFVAKDASLVPFVGDAIALADASSVGAGRVQVRFRDYSNAYINLGNQGQMIIDSWGTIDDGNAMLIAEAGDFDAAEALAILADPEEAKKNYFVAQAQELLAANASNHAERPALGQYGTDAYENLAAIVVSDTATAASVEYFIAAFEASKCLPVFTIDGVNDYAAGMSIYDDGGQFLRWKATDRSDESMLWSFDMTDTIVGVTDKVVIKNLSTGNLFMGNPPYEVSYIRIAETAEDIADDGLFLMFREEDTEYAIWASQSGVVVPSQGIFSVSSTSAWKFTYAGTTYGADYELPEIPGDVPAGSVTDLAVADPTKCYTISTTVRGAWAINADGTYFSTTGVEGYEIDAEDARQQFAILSVNAQDYYLYSVSAKKFVKRDRTLAVGVGDAIEFVDASSFEEGRVLVRFRDFINANINIGGDYQITIDRWGIIDEGNAVLIAEAGDFDATEALAALADPEAAELAALVAQVQELVEANAANHAVEPALGQYSTAAYDALVAVANTDSASKASLEAAIAAFEAAKCLPVFTITGFDPDKSIYESTNYNGLYWKELDRTDETMLWVFYMTDTIVGVTDRVVVKNLATGNYFGNGTFIQVTETEEEIADDGYFLIYYEGTGTPLCAYRNGQVMGGDAWSVMSDAAWKFTYVGTTYGANTPYRNALEVLLNRAKGYNPYSGSELGYYVEDFGYLLDAIAEAEALLLGEPSEAECEAMVAELSQAVEQFESSDRAFRLPEPSKAYRIVSALPAFYELQSVEKAITINASDNTLWWGDLCPDSLQQEFVFEPVLGDSGVHLSWNMDINLGNGTTISETQYFYNVKNVATGLYASYNDSAKFHLAEQPCTVYLTCLGVGQFGLKFRVENEYGGGNIYTVHAGDHNEGVPSDSIGDYGGVFGISSGIVSWYGGLDTPSAWYIREYPAQTDTVPSLQLVGVTPDSEIPEPMAEYLKLSFNEEVIFTLPEGGIVVRGINTGKEFTIREGIVVENTNGSHIFLHFLDEKGTYERIATADTYTYTIPAGAIKSVDGEVFPETTPTFTIYETFPLVSYSPRESSKLETIVLNFDREIVEVNMPTEGLTITDLYYTPVTSVKKDVTISEDKKTVVLELESPISTAGRYFLDLYNGMFLTEDGVENGYDNLDFTVIEDTPVISTDYAMKAQDVKGRASSVVNIPIEMDNVTAVNAFQFDLYLPEGVSVVSTMEDDEVLYDIAFNKNRSKSSHVLAVEPQDDGALRVAGYSTSNAAFVGNSGVLVNVAVSVGDIAEGDYSVVMRNIRMVTEDEQGNAVEKLGADYTATLTVENTLLGDVNSDGNFTMIDVVMAVNAVLEKEQAGFNAAAADLNGDGAITMVDVVGVLRLVLTDGSAAKAPVRRESRSVVAMPELSTGDIATMGNGRVVLPVALSNDADYSAFQLDVTLPAGVELAEATLTGRGKASHAVAWNTLTDGLVRIVAYAMDNAAFRDNDGALLNLVLETTGEVSADAVLTLADGLFATAGGAEHRAADVSVMMRAGTTGMEACIVAFRAYGAEGAVVVECAADTALSIYAATGALVEQTVVKAGKTSIALPAGVYVVNGNKVIVK